MKLNRNDPCPCGSGLKYKKCCLNNTIKATTISYAWQKMRRTDAELDEPLMEHALALFGKKGLEEAWLEFHCFAKDTPELAHGNMIFEQAFMPWFLYNWYPGSNEELVGMVPNVIAAEDYLTKYSRKLDSYQKSFILANLKSQYSIYEVVHVVRQQSITLKDVLRGHQVTIHEKRGSESLEKGYVLMARLLTLNEESIACGMYFQPLPSKCLLSFVDFKQHFSGNRLFTDEMLFEMDLEIRQSFMDEVNHLLQNPYPQLKNTDGEAFSINKVCYTLTCTPQRAFDALAELAIGIDKSELSQDGIYDANNQLIEIEFPWLVVGNRSHKDWENTVHGTIVIKEHSLTIEANSAARAKAALAEINARLTIQEATYLHTEQKSIEELMSEPRENKSIPGADSPQLQAMLKELSARHWNEWLDSKIPALNHVTPREAAKTVAGRERLEALFVDFHQKNLSGFSDCPVDLHYLRQELGMT